MTRPMTRAEMIEFSRRIWDQLREDEWTTARKAFEKAYPFEKWDSRTRPRAFSALNLGAAVGVVERREVPCGMRTYVRWRKARCRTPRRYWAP